MANSKPVSFPYSLLATQSPHRARDVDGTRIIQARWRSRALEYPRHQRAIGEIAVMFEFYFTRWPDSLCVQPRIASRYYHDWLLRSNERASLCADGPDAED